RATDTNRVFVSGWEGSDTLAACQMTSTCTSDEIKAGNIVGWWQQQFGAEQSQVTDERIDGRIAFQWRPSENTLLTIDDNYSRQKVTTETYGFALWFNAPDLRNITLDENGTVIDYIQPGTPMDLNASINNVQLKTNQVGVNFKIDASENLHFDIDASYAKSWQNPDGERNDGADIGYGGTIGTALGVRILGDSSDTLPQLTTYGPSGDTSRYLDPSVIGSHVLVRMQQENTDTIKQGRFTTTWEQDDLRLDLGVSYMDDNFTLQNSNTFANNFWQAFAGYGAPSGRSAGVVVPESLYSGTIGTGGFIPGFSGGGALPPQLLVYNPRALYSFLEGLGDPWVQQIDGFNYPGPGDDSGVTPTLANSLAACAGAAPPALCNYHGSLDLLLDPGSVQDI